MAAVEKCTNAVVDHDSPSGCRTTPIEFGRECGKPANFRYYLRGYKWYRCSDCLTKEHNPEQWELIPRDGMGPKVFTEEQLNQSIVPSTEELLEQRGSIYGDVAHNMICAANLNLELSKWLDKNLSYTKLPLDQQKVFAGNLTMITHKLARIATGDITYLDNYADIGGYAKLLHDKMGKYAKDPDSI